MSQKLLDVPDPATLEDLVEAAKRENLSLIPAVWGQREKFGQALIDANEPGSDITDMLILVEDAALSAKEVLLWTGLSGAREQLPDLEPLKETWSADVLKVFEAATMPPSKQPEMDFFENYKLPAPQGDEPVVVVAGSNPDGDGYVILEAA